MRRVALVLGLAAVATVVLASASARSGSAGRLIAYWTESGTRAQVWTVDSSTDRTDVLARKGANVVDPAWSPDGTRLVVAIRDHRRSPGPLGLAVVSPGGALHRITSPEPAGRDTAPDWSADGRWIGFVRYRKGSTAARLYRVHPDGTALRPLVTLRSIAEPAWSPDGRSIALIHEADLYVLSVRTGLVQRLTRSAAIESSPDWSPDGRLIVLDRSTGVGGQDAVYVVRSNGTGARRVTPLHDVLHRGEAAQPSWVPDGRIIYVAYGGQGDSQARLMVEDADGHGRHLILRLPSARGIRGPTWQPG